FSKFLSTCFAFSFLFSGSQTYSMESRNLGNRMNLDMLGIGIRNNLGGDNESAATKSTVASPLDGIKVKIPEKCEFCHNSGFSRIVSYPKRRIRWYVCDNKVCLQRCYNIFSGYEGLKSRKLDTDDIHRCDFFKKNMASFKKFKEANYKCPGMSEQMCKILCAPWEVHDGDKLVDEAFLGCGHSVCWCCSCSKNRLEKAEPGTPVKFQEGFCPKCKSKFDVLSVMSVHSGRAYVATAESDFLKCNQLVDEKLNNEWRDRVILLGNFDNASNSDVLDSISFAFDKRRYGPESKLEPVSWRYQEFKLDENKFNRINDEMLLGETIVVFDSKAYIGESIHYFEKSELDGYIKSLIKEGRYKDIVYPVKGELRDKIEAIAIKFMEDNTITVPKKLYDEICSKMLKDDVE
ncbi:MAG: hypothetical protein J6P21_00345, partial [Clostridia bacterium]|nr:hypothetical protein [Clostridia bacterium]